MNTILIYVLIAWCAIGFMWFLGKPADNLDKYSNFFTAIVLVIASPLTWVFLILGVISAFAWEWYDDLVAKWRTL